MRDTGNIRKIINFTYTLKIYTNYKLLVFRTNSLKLNFWKLLRNSYCPKQLLTFSFKWTCLLKKLCMSKINTEETKPKQIQ